MREGVDRPAEGLVELLNPSVRLAGSADNRLNLGIFPLQIPLVKVELGVVVDFIDDQDDWGFLAVIFDEGEPIVRPVRFNTQPSIEHIEIKTPLGEEKFMGSMHNLLPTKVPNIELHRFLLRHRNGPMANVDPFCF